MWALVWKCVCVCEGVGGGGEWVIWSQGKRKPLFKLQLLSHKCLLLWQCCGSFSHSITVHRNAAESENRWEGRSERGGNRKDKRSYEKNRLTETHKDRVGRNLSANQSGNKLYERQRQVQRETESKRRIKKEEELQTDMQTDTRKRREVIPPMPVFCFLWSVATSGCAYPQASPLLEFTVWWACLLIKHMWTCRGMRRDKVLRTASLYIQAHTCMHRNGPFFISACTVPADTNTNTFVH